MAVWHIVVLYLAIFALLQFVVYRYLRGKDGGTPSAMGASNPESGGFEDHRPDPSMRRDPDRRTPDRRDREEADVAERVRHCPQCGAPNEGDGTFTYCRNCASPLGR